MYTEKRYRWLCTNYKFCSNSVKKLKIKIEILKTILDGVDKDRKWAIDALEKWK